MEPVNVFGRPTHKIPVRRRAVGVWRQSLFFVTMLGLSLTAHGMYYLS